MSKRILMVFATLVSAITLTTAFAAGDADKQIDTAVLHAQMASATKDIDMVHAHLHHVLNCLVGPAGKQFDASAENPCKDMGNGALTDLAGMPKLRAKLEKAVKIAEKGVNATKFDGAHAAAVKTEKLLMHAAKKNKKAATK